MSDTKRVPPINLTYDELDYLRMHFERAEPPADAQFPDDPDYDVYSSVSEKLRNAERRANCSSNTDTECGGGG